MHHHLLRRLQNQNYYKSDDEHFPLRLYRTKWYIRYTKHEDYRTEYLGKLPYQPQWWSQFYRQNYSRADSQ